MPSLALEDLSLVHGRLLSGVCLEVNINYSTQFINISL